MPLIAVGRDLQRAQGEESCASDRMLQVLTFGERGLEVIVGGQMQTGPSRHDERLGLHGELELETQQAIHIG